MTLFKTVRQKARTVRQTAKLYDKTPKLYDKMPELYDSFGKLYDKNQTVRQFDGRIPWNCLKLQAGLKWKSEPVAVFNWICFDFETVIQFHKLSYSWGNCTTNAGNRMTKHENCTTKH